MALRQAQINWRSWPHCGPRERYRDFAEYDNDDWD